jgi:hypothetical protein
MPSYSTELNMFTGIYRRVHVETYVSLATFSARIQSPLTGVKASFKVGLRWVKGGYDMTPLTPSLSWL